MVVEYEIRIVRPEELEWQIRGTLKDYLRDHFRDIIGDAEIQISRNLNDMERKHPRKDPMLRALNTAQWSTDISEVFSSGNGALVYEVACHNAQRPFPYHFRQAGIRSGGANRVKSIGNLAAVRLNQSSGTVRPKKPGGWIIFWSDTYGKYVYTKSRQKSGPGHLSYKRNVDKQITEGMERWFN